MRAETGGARAGMPNSPCRNAGLTVTDRPTHRVETSDSPWRGGQRRRVAPADGVASRITGARRPSLGEGRGHRLRDGLGPLRDVTSAIADPPNPPPVIRAPSAPAARAVSHARSSSAHDTS